MVEHKDAAALYDAREYLIAGLENQAEWWEHLGYAHRDYAALARLADVQGREVERLRAAMWHIVNDSPGTPDSVKKYLLRELEGAWGEAYEKAMLR